MTDNEMLTILKTGMNITSNNFNDVLLQKGRAVELYMLNAGVDSTQIENHIGKAVLVIGTTDLWKLESGEIEFSKTFNSLFEHLKVTNL